MINNNMINNNMIDNKINNLHELDINNLDELGEWFDKAMLEDFDGKLISQNIKKLKDNDVNMHFETLMDIYYIGHKMFNTEGVPGNIERTPEQKNDKYQLSFHYNLNDLEQGIIVSPKDLYDVLEKYTYKFLNDDNFLDLLAIDIDIDLDGDKKLFKENFKKYWLHNLKFFEEIKNANTCSGLYFMDPLDIEGL